MSATIKELRTDLKLSQAAFAKSIGISTASVVAYENGHTIPRKKVLDKIKEVYGAEISFASGEAKGEKAPSAEKPKRGKKKAANVKDVPAEKTTKEKRGKKKADTEKAEKPKRTRKAKNTVPTIIIQSALGGSITVEEIVARIGTADQVYVRVDENKAYWVRGEETGSVDLW